jgi:hypothetical protein
VTAGEAIAALGDQHLMQLEERCKLVLASILAEKDRVDNSLHDGRGGSELHTGVTSGQGHTEVALAYTEVLQLLVSKSAYDVMSSY